MLLVLCGIFCCECFVTKIIVLGGGGGRRKEGGGVCKEAHHSASISTTHLGSILAIENEKWNGLSTKKASSLNENNMDFSIKQPIKLHDSGGKQSTFFLQFWIGVLADCSILFFNVFAADYRL